MAYVLIGFMGAGKSTVAGELAQALGGDPLDSDALLEQRFGHPVTREFELRGEAAFRAAEEQLVIELLAGARAEDVIALGGGSVTSERVRTALAGHTVVLLDVDAEAAWARVHAADGARGDTRPLARDRHAFAALHADRIDLYDQLADAVVSGLDVGAGARLLPALRALAAAGAGARLLWASAASGGYPVLVRSGLLGGDVDLDAVWPLDRARSRPFLVSDDTVSALYAARLGPLAGSVAIAPGESHKTLAGAQQVWGALLAAGATRADHVVALGGGVVGDLAGFCAATYQRGVPVVQIPTTLVAQVDSAYGGKTGVDLPQAKNYVGAYHQPAGVLVDPALLRTLPAAELAAGWVEVAKTALIAGGRLWQAIAADQPVDERVIAACARTKLAVVAADERDGGRRQVLNLGHTVGHAIETVTGYTVYRHGEAVGLGLLAALRLSGQDELRQRVRALMLAHALPVSVPDLDVDAILQAMTRDKKRTREGVPFVLVRAPGDVVFGQRVDDRDVRAAVLELRA